MLVKADLTCEGVLVTERVPLDAALERWPWLADYREELNAGIAVFAGSDVAVGAPGADQGVFSNGASPFHRGQPIRHKQNGSRGVFGFSHGRPAAWLNCDDEPTCIDVSEWGPA